MTSSEYTELYTAFVRSDVATNTCVGCSSGMNGPRSFSWVWICWYSDLRSFAAVVTRAFAASFSIAGSPTGTWLTKYRDGKMAFGLSLWGPDYPDPADYLAFTPGQLVGIRAGWPKGSDPAIEKLAAKALVTTSAKDRKSLYQQIQTQLNERGPFMPLLQPTQVFVATSDLTNAVYNSVYSLDVTHVSPK